MIIGKGIYLAYDGKGWHALLYREHCPGNSIVEVTIEAGWARRDRDIVRAALEQLLHSSEFDELCDEGLANLQHENVIPFPERP